MTDSTQEVVHPSDRDKQLLFDLQSSDLKRRDRAYTLLYNTAGTKLKSHFRKFGASDADAEDWVNEAFRIFHAKLNTFRGDSSPTTWLYKIAHSVRINSFRQTTRHRNQSLEDLMQRPLDEAAVSAFTDDALGPEEIAISAMYVECVLQALKEFVRKKPEQAELIMWKGFDELEYEAIAEILETTIHNVRQKIHVARKTIKELADHCDNEA